MATPATNARRRHSWILRAAQVFGGTLVLVGLGWLIGGPSHAMGALIAFPILTLMTIPDLDNGEYDLFGLAVLAALVIAGLTAKFLNDRPTVRWTKEMCSDPGSCPEGGTFE